jgi:hypothetical protein
MIIFLLIVRAVAVTYNLDSVDQDVFLLFRKWHIFSRNTQLAAND